MPAWLTLQECVAVIDCLRHLVVRWDDIRSEQLHDTGVFYVDEFSQSSTVDSNNSIGTIE
jgi:hypothetical protein